MKSWVLLHLPEAFPAIEVSTAAMAAQGGISVTDNADVVPGEVFLITVFHFSRQDRGFSRCWSLCLMLGKTNTKSTFLPQREAVGNQHGYEPIWPLWSLLEALFQIPLLPEVGGMATREWAFSAMTRKLWSFLPREIYIYLSPLYDCLFPVNKDFSIFFGIP